MAITSSPVVPTRIDSAMPEEAAVESGRADEGPAVVGLVRAAVHLDVTSVTAMVGASIAEHGVVRTWERLIGPARSSLVRDDCPEPFIAERLFDQAVSRVFRAAARRLAGRAPLKALLACADEEDQSLPLDVMAAALAGRGTGSCVLGTRVPPQALAAAVRRLRPAVVIVWSQTGTADTDQIISVASARPGTAVIAAGPGWDPAALPVSVAPSRGVTAALERTRILLDAPRSGVQNLGQDG